jgi:F-type H+-transporting ATPase subunit epsilon
VAEAREERREGRQLFCRIITPEEMIFDGEADLVVARIADGEIGVLVDHAPVVSTVEIGEVRITDGEDKHIYATSDGFFKVSENLVQILVEEAIPAGEIDVSEAENRVEEAESEISGLGGEEDAEDRLREAERRQRIGENLVHVARKYGEG